MAICCQHCILLLHLVIRCQDDLEVNKQALGLNIEKERTHCRIISATDVYLIQVLHIMKSGYTFLYRCDDWIRNYIIFGKEWFW